MKRITRFRSAAMMIAALTFVTSFTSCKKDDKGILKVQATHSTLTIEDAKMQEPVGDNTLLYDKAGHTPVTAPDGHHVTLGEFNKVSGYAQVKCINAGTHVVMHFKGLIPNGVYTVWVVTFQSPGFEETLSNVIGVGALGAGDGSQNSFTASAAGTASLSATMPTGAMSEFGTVGSCLGSEYEIQFWSIYHMDGLTHGGSPGDESTWVLQSLFQFKGSQL